MLAEEFVMSHFAMRRSNKGYQLLCLAIQEASSLYPHFPTFDVFCRNLLKSTQETSVPAVQRTLARAVENLWDQKGNRRLFNYFYGYQVVEKPSAKDFVYTMGGYVCRKAAGPADTLPLRMLPGTIEPFIAAMPDGRPCLAIPLDNLTHISEAILQERAGAAW